MDLFTETSRQMLERELLAIKWDTELHPEDAHQLLPRILDIYLELSQLDRAAG